MTVTVLSSGRHNVPYMCPLKCTSLNWWHWTPAER